MTAYLSVVYFAIPKLTKSVCNIYIIVNDRIRLLFIVLHRANVSERMCGTIQIYINGGRHYV